MYPDVTAFEYPVYVKLLLIPVNPVYPLLITIEEGKFEIGNGAAAMVFEERPILVTVEVIAGVGKFLYSILPDDGSTCTTFDLTNEFNDEVIGEAQLGFGDDGLFNNISFDILLFVK